MTLPLAGMPVPARSWLSLRSAIQYSSASCAAHSALAREGGGLTFTAVLSGPSRVKASPPSGLSRRAVPPAGPRSRASKLRLPRASSRAS
jgi:hypothetical protein